MLRRTKSEALDLPEKVRSWVPVDVPIDPGPRRRAAGPRLPRRAPGPLGSDLGARSSACSTGPATPWPSPRRRRPPTSSPTASRPARRSSCSRRTRPSSRRCASASATPASRSPARTSPAARDAAVAALPDRRLGPGVRRQPPRRRRRHHPDRRHARRVQRPRLGAGQPLAGRGPHPPHRPDRDDVRHLPPRRRHARRLRRRAARAEGGHDRHARGRRPRPRLDHRRRRRPRARRTAADGVDTDAAAPPRPTMGLLEETLDLLDRFRGDQLAAHAGEDRSSSSRAASKPGVVYDGAPHQRRRRVRLPRLHATRATASTAAR